MGRPSKLSEKQWAEVEKRLLNGEKPAALAKEYGIDRAGITRKFSHHVRNIKHVANQVFQADVALKSLPVAQQVVVISLVDELKAMSSHLASAGKYGAMTAHRLSMIAHIQTDKIDDANPVSSEETLKVVGGLTRMANASSEIAINLLRANKDFIEGVNGSKELGEMTDDDIRQELIALGE